MIEIIDESITAIDERLELYCETINVNYQH